MFTQGFDFKKVELGQRGCSAGKKKTVYMTKITTSKKKDKTYARVNITGDLVKEAGFQHGDRVDLLQSGTMFAFKKEKVGLLTVKTAGGNVLCINSVELCRHLRANTKQCTEFDAFVSDGMIVFKPKE